MKAFLYIQKVKELITSRPEPYEKFLKNPSGRRK